MNKHLLSTLVISVLALCCAPPDNYIIRGNADGTFEGDTVYLFYSKDGKEKTIANYSIVTDGTFAFGGYTEGENIYYLGHMRDGDDVSTMFFLEKGEMQACLKDGSVTGTPLNDTNRRVSDSIGRMIQEINTLETRLINRANRSSDDIMHDGITMFALQERLYSYLKRVVTENIGNIYGLFMLVMYNGLFNEEEFDSILNRIPARYAGCDNNSLYRTAMEIKALKAEEAFPTEP